MTTKSRIAKLEKIKHLRGMSWLQFIQCDNPETLPPDLREKWKIYMETHTRGIDTLAQALTETTGQETSPAEAENQLRKLTDDNKKSTN